MTQLDITGRPAQPRRRVVGLRTEEPWISGRNAVVLARELDLARAGLEVLAVPASDPWAEVCR